MRPPSHLLVLILYSLAPSCSEDRETHIRETDALAEQDQDPQTEIVHPAPKEPPPLEPAPNFAPSGQGDSEAGAAADTSLPEALRGRFTVLDETQDAHGDGLVPRAIEHTATGLPFLFVPGGSFTFGSQADDTERFDDERPPRRVSITGFYICATETTLAAWRRGGGEGGSAPADEHPVHAVTWFQARDWCRANDLVLPTEAQWEYAASGERDDLFPWGHSSYVKGRGNFSGTNDVDLWSESAPVGSFEEGTSWCGAVDMAGNVLEWCRDIWTPHHGAITEGQRDPFTEAEGDALGHRHVMRGGSYSADSVRQLRCAFRDSLAPTLDAANLGFRAVVPAF